MIDYGDIHDGFYYFMLPDPQRTVQIDDDTWLSVCVERDGSEYLWFFSRFGDHSTCGCACFDHAPHEQLGPLPLSVRLRLCGDSTPRCGAPTRSTGCPCMTPVERLGLRCRWHREATT